MKEKAEALPLFYRERRICCERFKKPLSATAPESLPKSTKTCTKGGRKAALRHLREANFVLQLGWNRGALLHPKHKLGWSFFHPRKKGNFYGKS